MNPYQKIVIDGEEIQPGRLDTKKKFEELTQGVDLKGKRVLDVGCNLGMMCYLAKEAGAGRIVGVDINPEYIDQARKLWPKLEFNVNSVYKLNGKYDIVIASAMMHYVADLPRAFDSLFRVTDMVLGDFNVADELYQQEHKAFFLDYRDLWIPTKKALVDIALKYFNTVIEVGPAMAPDDSTRVYYRLEGSKAGRPKAELIYGTSGTGKTSLMSTFLDRKQLQTDAIYVSWRVTHGGEIMDVSWNSEAMRGKFADDYENFYIEYLTRWLNSSLGQDVVIEGFDLFYDQLRGKLVMVLEALGWEVDQRELKGKYWL